MPTSRRESLSRAAHLRRLLFIYAGTGIVILSIICYLLGDYGFAKYRGEWTMPPLWFLLLSPKYLAVNEEEEIRITAENLLNAGVQGKLRLNGKAMIGNGTNVFFAGEIPGREQIDRRVPVIVPSDSGLIDSTEIEGRNAGLTLWVSVGNRAFEKVADLPIRVAPISSPKTLFGLAFGLLSSLIIGSAKQWWDIAKQVAGKPK